MGKGIRLHARGMKKSAAWVVLFNSWRPWVLSIYLCPVSYSMERRSDRARSTCIALRVNVYYQVGLYVQGDGMESVQPRYSKIGILEYTQIHHCGETELSMLKVPSNSPHIDMPQLSPV